MSALFEPYSQAKRSITRSHGGTGLGLAIVKCLSDLMHGEIMIESEVGCGTSFSFSTDFLLAKPPTPIMASMIRTLGTNANVDVATIRYNNYANLACTDLKPHDIKSEATSPTVSDNAVPRLSQNGTSTHPPSYTLVPPGSIPPPSFGSLPEPIHFVRGSSKKLINASDHATTSETELAKAPHSGREGQSNEGVVAEGITRKPSSARMQVSVGNADVPPVALNGRTLIATTDGTQSVVVNPLASPLDTGATGLLGPGETPSPIVVPTPSASSSAQQACLRLCPTAACPKPFVLVVDDAAINRKILLKMLQADYQIEQAENGLEAVNLIDANPGKYVCVLMDLMVSKREQGGQNGVRMNPMLLLQVTYPLVLSDLVRVCLSRCP
jgi:hypothetical protein